MDGPFVLWYLYENVPLPNPPRQRGGSPFSPVDGGIKGEKGVHFSSIVVINRS